MNRPASLFFHHHWAPVALFVALGLLVYSNTFHVPFIYDDVPSITENTSIRLTEITPETLIRSGFTGYAARRPVASISFALNYYFHQYEETGYHVVNLAIHLLTGIWLYFLSLTILKQHAVGDESGISRFIPFLSTLIWLVHPLQTQSVTYVVQRMNSLCAMFYVLSLLLYVNGRALGGGKKRWIYFAGSALSGLLALGSKEIAATLPFVILLYEWYFIQDLRWTWLKRCLPFVIASVILVWVFSWVHLGANPVAGILGYYERYHLGFSVTERVLTEFRVVVFYMTLLFFPHPSRLNLDHEFALSHSLLNPPATLGSLFIIVGLLAIAVWTARKERLISFCILWFLCNLAIESSVIGMEVIYEHRLYLPSMFFFLPFMTLAFRYVKQKRVLFAGVTAVIMVFCLWTYQRNLVWKNPVSLWSDCAKKSPDNFRPHFNLGNFLAKEGRLDEAVASYRKALSVKPYRAEIHFNLANTFIRMGQLEDAAEHYRKALRSDPEYVEAETGLGVALARLGKLEEAVSHYEKALEIEPGNALVHHNLGFSLARLGRLDEAVEHYREAIRIRPNYPQAQTKLKIALSMLWPSGTKGDPSAQEGGAPSRPVQMYLSQGINLAQQGRFDEAREAFEKALQMAPDNAEGHYNMAVLLSRQGKLSASADHYKEALQIKPDYVEAHNNLGIVLMRLEKVHEAIAHFAEAVRLNPGFEQAEKNLRRAKRRAK